MRHISIEKSVKMFRYILVLFVVTTAFGDHDHHDGPCPKPAVDLLDAGEVEFPGHIFGVCSNSEYIAKKRQCYEVLVDEKPDAFYAKIHYRDGETQTDVEAHNKYISEEHGRYTEYQKNADGEYEATGWTYSVVKMHGVSALEFVCKEEGDKHIDYYQVSSKTLPLPEDTKKVLMEAYEATGDSRKTPYYFNHENCDYKYD